MIVCVSFVVYMATLFFWKSAPLWFTMGGGALFGILLFITLARHLVKKEERDAEIWAELDSWPRENVPRRDSRSAMEKYPAFFHPAFKDFSANIWHKD